MADTSTPEGRAQNGQDVQGQHVYWVTMARLTPKVHEARSLRQPSKFTAEHFSNLFLQTHGDHWACTGFHTEINNDGAPTYSMHVNKSNEYEGSQQLGDSRLRELLPCTSETDAILARVYVCVLGVFKSNGTSCGSHSCESAFGN